MSGLLNILGFRFGFEIEDCTIQLFQEGCWRIRQFLVISFRKTYVYLKTQTDDIQNDNFLMSLKSETDV